MILQSSTAAAAHARPAPAPAHAEVRPPSPSGRTGRGRRCHRRIQAQKRRIADHDPGRDVQSRPRPAGRLGRRQPSASHNPPSPSRSLSLSHPLDYQVFFPGKPRTGGGNERPRIRVIALPSHRASESLRFRVGPRDSFRVSQWPSLLPPSLLPPSLLPPSLLPHAESRDTRARKRAHAPRCTLYRNGSAANC